MFLLNIKIGHGTGDGVTVGHQGTLLRQKRGGRVRTPGLFKLHSKTQAGRADEKREGQCHKIEGARGE